MNWKCVLVLAAFAAGMYADQAAAAGVTPTEIKTYMAACTENVERPNPSDTRDLGDWQRMSPQSRASLVCGAVSLMDNLDLVKRVTMAYGLAKCMSAIDIRTEKRLRSLKLFGAMQACAILIPL